ncbi:hypothetical protein BpHYR1_026040 [Brachionus plicatilis]|uniref:Uncharacterized protein n=1 Tax=Brachionus plicatilis TaxID=10195 RepID=A0A3M7SZZ5_BRAPC|nr:hypothetical protein BpHYR1_026040 [Brachionus plicatilis]
MVLIIILKKALKELHVSKNKNKLIFKKLTEKKCTDLKTQSKRMQSLGSNKMLELINHSV